MISKLKVLAPFALAAMTLVNCGGHNGELKSRIKRVEYQQITGNNLSEQVHEALDSIFAQQTESDFPDMGTRRLKLPPAGSINTTLEIALNGSISHNELHMDEFNIANKTNYQMSWNFDKKYVEFKTDEKSSYIVYDDYGVGDYYYAYSYSADGKEVKERAPMLLSDSNFDFYLRDFLRSRSLFFEFIDLGLSGLGYNPLDFKYDNEKPVSIGSVFHGSSLYKIYDYLNEKAGDGHSLSYKVATSGAGTFSGDLTAHFDLKTLKENVAKDIPEEFKDIIEPIIANSVASGNFDFDLFAAWDKNYICQQEYIAKANNLYFAKLSDRDFIEIKATGDGYFGEEFTQQFDVADETIQQILKEYESIV